MKKITAIIAVSAVAAVLAFTGCQKQEAPKPVEHSAMTSTVTSTVTTTVSMGAPEKK